MPVYKHCKVDGIENPEEGETSYKVTLTLENHVQAITVYGTLDEVFDRAYIIKEAFNSRKKE